MKIPFKYIIKNFKTRKLTTGITIFGVALVVLVFSAVLMMADGVKKTLVATGLPENVKVVRKSATSEISSIIDGDTQNIIKTLPHIAKNDKGDPILSDEVVVIINLKIKDGGMSNITVRGIGEQAIYLRPNIKITSGRMFNPALRELIVGGAIHKKFLNSDVGDQIKFAGDEWKIVGTFDAGGSGFDSEILGDSRQLLDAFNRGSSASAVTFKLDDLNNFDKVQKIFESDRRLQQFEVKLEQKYYEEQSQFLSGFISILGIFITVIFSLGATIGATITMYSAVANRTIEIGTLRSLGFSRRSILSAFLIESVLISLIGCAVGLFFSMFLQFFSISTLNFQSFSELSFSFVFSASVATSSVIFALLMGILGGFFPAVRAATVNIVTALRG
ncbi:MAG: ABC transporter permease [Bacteroidetes bacterium]|nr:ABC transporter permease [Bacteroidota bacterium]